MKINIVVEVDVPDDLLGTRVENVAADILDQSLRTDPRFKVLYPPEQLFTDEQRAKVMELIDLREYANAHICGDGLEIDRAKRDFDEMSDLDVVLEGMLEGVDCSDPGEKFESELRSKLRALPPDVVDVVVRFVRERVEGAIE